MQAATHCKQLPTGERLQADTCDMELSGPPARTWFGPDFVERQRNRFGQRPPEQRQLTYDIAVDEEYAPWRAWLDEQLLQLDPQQADTLATKVWLDENFWTVIYELAVGAHLRAQGFLAAYERNFDGLTPDWTILHSSGTPLGFIEVHTDNPSRETFGQMRAWHGLVQRIKQIAAPVVLMLASSGEPPAPPDAHTAKTIARELRNQLLAPTWPSPPAFSSAGYTFHVIGDRTGGLMESPLGLSACFEPPSCRAGIVSADRLLENTQKKVAKYRELARAYHVPLAVAVGSHKFTGVTLDTVDHALQGSQAPSLTVQFGPGDTFIAPTKTFEWKAVPPWSMPADLAALMWISHTFPFNVTVRPNPLAVMPLPVELTEWHRHQRAL